jgi:hypothetical protein
VRLGFAAELFTTVNTPLMNKVTVPYDAKREWPVTPPREEQYVTGRPPG